MLANSPVKGGAVQATPVKVRPGDKLAAAAVALVTSQVRVCHHILNSFFKAMESR